MKPKSNELHFHPFNMPNAGINDTVYSGIITDRSGVVRTRLVPLETTNESLLGEIRKIISLSDEYILIADRDNVYKFYREGKFINIKERNGPGEISGSCRYYFNRKSKTSLIRTVKITGS